MTLRFEERPRGLADTLRAATALLHRRAEQSGVVADILRSRASRDAYALYLRNLLPAYAALESGVVRIASPALRRAAPPELHRRVAIVADLDALAPDWRATLPLLPPAEAYAARVERAAEGDGHLLLGHAYVRYFGDINGGQILRRLLRGRLALPDDALSFYDFPGIEALDLFKRRYRQDFDAALADAGDIDALAGEAVAAFELNIAVSEAVRAAAMARA